MGSSPWEELFAHDPQGDLEQGDIVANGGFLPLSDVSHLVVLTQTCDLVLRPHKNAGATPFPRRSFAMVAPAVPFPPWVATRYPDKAPHNIANAST